MDLTDKGVNAVADLATKAVKTEIEVIKRVRDGDVPFVVVDKGKELKPVADLVIAFEKTQPAPYRRRGNYQAASIAALLAWMEKHCDTTAPVFGEGAENLATTWAKPKLSLIGIANYSDKDKAAWHDLTVRYDFPVTLTWEQWTKNNKQWMDQAEFAEFVESHLYEFSEPLRNESISESLTRFIEAMGGTKVVAAPQKIWDMSRGIKINVSEKVEVELDRNSGETVMRFSEEHTGAGGRPVAIPKMFYIRIPIFFGETPSLIGAVLRYRNAGGGKVVWSYELFAPDLTVQEAFDKATRNVSGTRTFYLGSPDKPNL